jgi:hypothetical protein
VATPEISVWLTDTPESEAFAKPLQRSMKKTKADTVRFDADQFATIEDVTLEDKAILVTESGRLKPIDSKQCIVVRVEHTNGRPVMVQLLGNLHRGEEHHYFHSANKYTAMFWDLSSTSQEMLSFNVIFLDALKKEVTPAVMPVAGRNANFPPPYSKMVN